MAYRILGFLAGFAVAILGGWVLMHAITPEPRRVIDEHHGSLAIVEFQYSQAAAKDTWPVLSAFFDQVAPRVKVIGVCSFPADEIALRKEWKWPLKLKTLVMNAEITGWSKDRFLVESGSPATLLGPRPDPNPIPGRNNDALIAEALAKKWPKRFQSENGALAFDAGDILSTQTTSIFSDSLAAKNGNPPDLASRVKTMTGLEPLWLKGVPDHHIGMFAVPIDTRTVIVGDPDLGKKVWNDKVAKGFGVPDFSQSTTQPFRNAISQFENAGFKVVRTPILILAPKVYATATNAVLETVGGRKIAYVPTYGLESFDAAGAAAYRSQGWEVKSIPVRSVFKFRGTIGCLVNVLARS